MLNSTYSYSQPRKAMCFVRRAVCFVVLECFVRLAVGRFAVGFVVLEAKATCIGIRRNQPPPQKSPVPLEGTGAISLEKNHQTLSSQCENGQ